MDALQAYRESEVTGDNPVHLVVLLYDQLLRDLRRALDAFEQRDIPRRCQELDHALLVLAQLQGSLNLQDGGEVADILDRFYDLVRHDLVQASIDDSPELVEKRWRNILGVREAWLEVERQQTATPPNPLLPHAAGDEMNGNAQRNSEWKV
jgi:flagellar protein FliS